MSKYRKKPIVVDAEQWFKNKPVSGVRKLVPISINHSRKDINGKEVGRGIFHEAPEHFVVDTLEGPLEVREGDWIITGVKGEKYPCKSDIFELTYEPVTTMNFPPMPGLGGMIVRFLLGRKFYE